MAVMGEPRKRITGKTSVMVLSAGDDRSVNDGMSPEVIHQRLLRGQEYANVEFKGLEHASTVEMVNIVSQMDQENADMECKVNKAMVRELKVAEEGIATEAQQDQFLQTKTIALSESAEELEGLGSVYEVRDRELRDQPGCSAGVSA